jgi:hypothetical protein
LLSPLPYRNEVISSPDSTSRNIGKLMVHLRRTFLMD